MDAGLKLGGVSRAAAREPNYKGGCYVIGTVENKTLVNPGFSHAKEFFRNLPAIWAGALKMFASPVLGRKI